MTNAARAAKLVVLLAHAGSCLPSPPPSTKSDQAAADSKNAFAKTAAPAATAAAEGYSPKAGSRTGLQPHDEDRVEHSGSPVAAEAGQDAEDSALPEHSSAAARDENDASHAEDRQDAAGLPSEAQAGIAEHDMQQTAQSRPEQEQPLAEAESSAAHEAAAEVSGGAADSDDDWQDGFTAAESPAAAADEADADAGDGCVAGARCACLQV